MALHIDATNGISGNMIVAALIDLGSDANEVIRVAERAASRLTDTKAVLTTVHRGQITAMHIDVLCDDTSFPIKDIRNALQSSGLEGREQAIRILDTLIQAEQEYHQTKHIHFHEIGCADLVFDIVGSLKAIELLGESEITCTPVSVGGGKVAFSHGTLDVPAPATQEILERFRIPFRKGPIERELATPTGVAILANIAGKYVDAVCSGPKGYGAGSAYNGIKNVLEITRAESLDSAP